MFIGHYYSVLTDKGRTAFPKKFRVQIGEAGICAKWYEGCLVIVGEDKWGALLERLTGKSEIITKPVRDTDRFILGSAFEIDFDAQGRFVVPKVLRDYAQLSDEIVFVGLGDRVEVWNKKDWEEREKKVADEAEVLIEEIASMGKGRGEDVRK